MIKVIKDSILTLLFVSAVLFWEPLSVLWCKIAALILVAMLCGYAIITQKLIDSMKELLKAHGIPLDAKDIVSKWYTNK